MRAREGEREIVKMQGSWSYLKPPDPFKVDEEAAKSCCRSMHCTTQYAADCMSTVKEREKTAADQDQHYRVRLGGPTV